MVPKIKDKSKSKPAADEVPTFIRKTYEILEDESHSDIVSWNDEGNAIVIKDPTEFGQKVLPIFFKHNNLTSFVRQLNMYDFHKKRSLSIEHIYYHELFKKGHKQLLKDIKRKNSDTTVITVEKALNQEESNYEQRDTATMASENNYLKKINKEAMQRMNFLDTQLKELTIQNQALWNQYYKQNEQDDEMRSSFLSFAKQNGLYEKLFETPSHRNNGVANTSYQRDQNVLSYLNDAIMPNKDDEERKYVLNELNKPKLTRNELTQQLEQEIKEAIEKEDEGTEFSMEYNYLRQLAGSNKKFTKNNPQDKKQQSDPLSKRGAEQRDHDAQNEKDNDEDDITEYSKARKKLHREKDDSTSEKSDGGKELNYDPEDPLNPHPMENTKSSGEV